MININDYPYDCYYFYTIFLIHLAAHTGYKCRDANVNKERKRRCTILRLLKSHKIAGRSK